MGTLLSPSIQKLVKDDKTTVMEDFLCQAFTPMENGSKKQLRSEFIVLNAAFTTVPWLDKSTREDCSKKIKSADSQLSEIQAHFVDAVGPLTVLLESIFSDTELSIEDIE